MDNLQQAYKKFRNCGIFSNSLDPNISNTRSPEELKAAVIKAVYNGFNSQRTNEILQTTLGLTDQEMRDITQAAVWYFTDNMTRSEANATRYVSVSGETQIRAYNLLIGQSTNTTDLALLKEVPTNVTLDIYKFEAGTTTNIYQNLLGATFVNDTTGEVIEETTESSTTITAEETTATTAAEETTTTTAAEETTTTTAAEETTTTTAAEKTTTTTAAEETTTTTTAEETTTSAAEDNTTTTAEEDGTTTTAAETTTTATAKGTTAAEVTKSTTTNANVTNKTATTTSTTSKNRADVGATGEESALILLGLGSITLAAAIFIVRKRAIEKK